MAHYTAFSVVVHKYKIDSHGQKSLVKRQHSTRRRCIGLEGAVNTTACLERTAKTTRAEVGGGGGGEEAGELGPMPSAAGVRPPPPSSRDDFRCAGGGTEQCAAALGDGDRRSD